METEQICQKVTEYRDILAEVGIKPTGMAYKRERIEKATPKERTEAWGWLVSFGTVYVAAFQRAKELVPPLTKQMYALSGMSYKTHEEEEIRGSCERLIAAWRDRPSILQRISHGKQNGKTGIKGAKSGSKGKKSGASRRP